MSIQDLRLTELAPTLRGQIDAVTAHVVRGWAFDTSRPAEAVELVVTDHGEELGCVRADLFREDLSREGMGTGHHGFELWLPQRLSPLERHVVRVFRRSDGRELFYSPVVLEPSDAFGSATRARIAEVLRAPMTVVEFDDRIAYFLDIVETLKQRRADEAADAEVRRRGAATKALRALVIDHALPDATRDAGSNAILSHLRALRRLGYEVTIVPADLKGVTGDAREALREERILVACGPAISSVEELLGRQRDTFDLVYIHRLDNAARYAPLVRAHQAAAHIVYSVADLHHQRLARQAMVEANLSLYHLAELTRLRELQAAWGADAIITHSRAEAKLLASELPGARVHTVPWDVPLDLIVRSFERRANVGFLGGFHHAPNVEAAQRLATRIMPFVWRTHPAIKAVILGSHVPDSVCQLAQRGIEVAGHAPDLFLALNRLRLTVAPLSFGAGIKGKVLESFARGLPCVMSPVAAEGMNLPDDLDTLVGETDEAIARKIVALHEDADLNGRLSAAGAEYVGAHWNAAGVDAALREACTPVPPG